MKGLELPMNLMIYVVLFALVLFGGYYFYSQGFSNLKDIFGSGIFSSVQEEAEASASVAGLAAAMDAAAKLGEVYGAEECEMIALAAAETKSSRQPSRLEDLFTFLGCSDILKGYTAKTPEEYGRALKNSGRSLREYLPEVEGCEFEMNADGTVVGTCSYAGVKKTVRCTHTAMKCCVIGFDPTSSATITGWVGENDGAKCRQRTWITDCSPAGVKPHYTCEVEFELPQEITAEEAQDWIIAFGDPQYLVYWQKWPSGEENAWMGKLEWAENSVTLFLVTKAAEVGTSCTLGKLGGSVLGRVLNLFKASRVKKIFFKSKKGVSAGDIKIDGTAEIRNAKKFNELSVEDKLKAIGLKAKDSMKRLGYGLAGGVSGAAAIETWLDSVTFKLETQAPDSLLLVSPGKKLNEFKLKYTEGYTFVALERYGPKVWFYSASPCTATYRVGVMSYYCKTRIDVGNKKMCVDFGARAEELLFPENYATDKGLWVRAENKDGFCFRSSKAAEAAEVLGIAAGLVGLTPGLGCGPSAGLTAVGAGLAIVGDKMASWP